MVALRKLKDELSILTNFNIPKHYREKEDAENALPYEMTGNPLFFQKIIIKRCFWRTKISFEVVPMTHEKALEVLLF